MKKTIFILSMIGVLYGQGMLNAHCQMPCGIYHDEMVYGQIDQYVETMFKGITMLNSNKFDNAWDRNEFVRWVIQKEKASDDVAELFTKYFLQQKIKPGEDDTVKRISSVHHMLFLLVQIKQNVDRKLIDEFADEWEKFKLMFHVENYECKVEALKNMRLQAKQKELEAKEQKDSDHDHDHNHDHEHEHNHDHDHGPNGHTHN